MYDKKYMMDNLMMFVENQLHEAKHLDLTASEIRGARAVAFGSIQFVITMHPEMYTEVNDYWTEMWEKFYQLERSRYLR